MIPRKIQKIKAIEKLIDETNLHEMEALATLDYYEKVGKTVTPKFTDDAKGASNLAMYQKYLLEWKNWADESVIVHGTNVSLLKERLKKEVTEQ